MAEDTTHPSGVVVEIVGIEMGDCGRSCEEHPVCGVVVEEDTLLRLRKVQILVDGEEETAIACYWVTDRIDRCRVGFLKRHMVRHVSRFDGALVQVMRVYSKDAHCSDTAERRTKYANHGCALGAVVSRLDEEDLKGKAKGGKAQGGGGSAWERKAPEGTISWRCDSCTYTNVEWTSRASTAVCVVPRGRRRRWRWGRGRRGRCGMRNWRVRQGTGREVESKKVILRLLDVNE